MVQPEKLKKILAIGIPVSGAMVLENLFTFVDILMIGQLGAGPVAVVSYAGSILLACSAILFGIGIAVQILAARRIGDKNREGAVLALNNGLYLCLLSGVLITLVSYYLAPSLFKSLFMDDKVLAESGTNYFQIRSLGLIFTALNVAFRGYWNTVDLAKIYMSTTIVANVINAFLNYGLIYGNFGFPALGVEGSAIGTLIAVIIGSALNFYYGFRRAGTLGFLRNFSRWPELKAMVALSIPTGAQQFLFFAQFSMLYWIVGHIGSVQLAAFGILMTIMQVAFIPGVAFGVVATTMVGHSLGADRAEDAEQWCMDIIKVGLVAMIVLSLPLFVFAENIIRIFINDTSTISAALLPLKISSLMLAFQSIGFILMQALMGSGDVTRASSVSIGVQWLFVIPIAFLLAVVLHAGLTEIWILRVTSGLIEVALFFLLWRGGQWKDLRV